MKEYWNYSQIISTCVALKWAQENHIPHIITCIFILKTELINFHFTLMLSLQSSQLNWTCSQCTLCSHITTDYLNVQVSSKWFCSYVLGNEYSLLVLYISFRIVLLTSCYFWHNIYKGYLLYFGLWRPYSCNLAPNNFIAKFEIFDTHSERFNKRLLFL